MLLNGLPDSCSGCSLSDNPKCGKFTAVSGRGRFRVLIVAEASGEEEAREGRPLIEWAPSGSILEKAIRLKKWRREDFWLTNVVRCRPPNNFLEGAPYERAAIESCRHNLDRVVAELQPGAILSLGGVATRELTGFTGGKRGVTYTRGYPLLSRYGIPCIPSLHPAFIARGNTRYLGLLMKDLGEAVAYASGRKTMIHDPSTFIQVKTRIEDLEELYERAKADPSLWIASDIETDESIKGDEDGLIEFEKFTDADDGDGSGEIGSDADLVGFGEPDVDWGVGEGSNERGSSGYNQLDVLQARVNSIQFALSDREGVFVKWRDPDNPEHERRVRELTQRIYDLPNPKIGHNFWLFDMPILKRHGIVFHDIGHDSRWMYKALQADLLTHLQAVALNYGWPFPWKHMAGVNEELYGVSDVCSLIMIADKLPGELQRGGLWNGYLRFKKRARERVLDWMERVGLPMSRERLDEFRGSLDTEIEEMRRTIEESVPPELHKREPTEKGFDNLPPEIKEFVYARNPEVITPRPRFKKDGSPLLDKEGNHVHYVGAPYTVTQIYNMLLNGELNGTLEAVLEKYPDLRVREDGKALYRHVPFNPRSPLQMIEYIKLKNYKIPIRFKDGAPTTASKEMLRLAYETKDPVIKLSHETRIHEKMRDSYTGKVGEDGVARGGWIPDEDGRLRARYTFVASWQLAATPNVLTMPKRRGDLAKKFRRCMVAEPGRVLVAFDYKSFHDLTTALEASDDIKFRLASKADPHAFVAGFLVKYPGIETCLSLSDDDLKAFLEEVRSRHEDVREYQAKPANHGTNFGQGPRRLQFENRDHIKTEGEARRIHAMLKRVFPKTFKWQEDVLHGLDPDEGGIPYLQSRWGARRWFWDAWAWKKTRDGKWYKTKGQDAEKAMAFLPSNDAHGMLMDKMLDMDELGYLEKYQLVNLIHDEALFHPPLELLEECIHNVREWMEGPVMTLAHPVLCPNGLVVKVDVSYGPDRADMIKVK